MAKAVQRRRGSSVEHASFTGVLAEITVDLTKKSLVVHDGTTVGGFTLAREDLTNTKTTSLATLTGAETASNDTFLIYDVSTNAMKSITRAELNNAIVIDDLENVKIVSGVIDGTTVGATTASTGRFTSLTATGNTIIDGNLTVNGTTTTISTTELTVEDKNITVAFGAANAAAADGAGLTVAGANALITYVSFGDKWSLNKPLDLGANNLTTTGTTSLNNLSYTGTLTGGTGVVNIGSGQIYKDASGNVGIGTAAPSAKLSLQQTGLSANTTMFNSITEHSVASVAWFDLDLYDSSSANGSSTMLRFRKANGTSASPVLVPANSVSGRLGSQIHDGAAFYDNALINFSADGTPALNSTPGRIQIYTTPVGSTTVSERMRITSTGNVGIGISAPTEKLHINGNIVVGGSTGFISTTNGGAAAITGIGIFPYTLPGGTTNSQLHGTIFAQNNIEFVGTNGASAQTYASVSSTPKISNSGAGGTGSTSSQSFLAWPTIQSSGSTARLAQIGLYAVSRRENANDTSTNLNNSVWGGAFFIGHESTLPTTASTGNVFGTYVIAANKAGIVRDLRAHDATIQVGLTSVNASSTTAAGFYLTSFAVGSASTNTATVTSGFGLRLAGPAVNATGTITDYYAVYAGPKTGAGIITNNWALYLADTTAKSFIGGDVGIGLTNPSEKLDVVGNIKSSGTITATNFVGALTPRISTIASTATITPNSDISDQYNVTALAETATFAIPSGTPTDGQKLSIRIKAVTTSQTISWVTTAGGYRVIGTILPLTAPVGKTIYVNCIYNAADSFWDVVTVAIEQ